MKQLTKNFHRKEFDCKDGTIVPEQYKANLVKLATNLQIIRDSIQDANTWQIRINSGYRTKAWNKQIGGAIASQHLTASAADLHQKKFTPLEFYQHIESLIEKGAIHNGGLFLYNTFVHYDIRQTPARGNYATKFKL